MSHAMASASLVPPTSTSAMRVSLSSSPETSSGSTLRSTFFQAIGFDGYCSSPFAGHKGDLPVRNTKCETTSTTGSESSQVGECVLRLEPLKIALESDDETSIGSCDDSDPALISRIPLDVHDDQVTKADYFHKPRHSRMLIPSTTPMASACQERSDALMEDCSGHSLPSLTGSDVSTASFRYSPTASTLSFNKKPRYIGQKGNVPKKRKTVSIHKSVSVISIPSRYEYSQRTRELIWTTASEIHANAARNAIEFCSENWKWQNALEDHQMFIHQGNGERVHPIHVHNAISLIDSFQGDPRNSEEIHFNLSLIAALVPPASIQAMNSDGSSSVFHDDDQQQQQPTLTHSQLQEQGNDSHDQARPRVSASSLPSATA